MDWFLGSKCDHWVWPWSWPWIFKVKYRIVYISAINGAIVTKQKAHISIDLKTSNVTIRFDLGHDLDLGFSRSNMELAICLWKMVRLPRNKNQTHRLNSRPQMWPSDLILAMTLTLNFQGQMGNLLYLNQKWSLSHPGIPGVTLCFCTGSYAGAAAAAACCAAGRRFLSRR